MERRRLRPNDRLERVLWRRDSVRAMRPIPTAPVAAGSLIAGYAVAAGSGSRPLGGAVLLLGGAWCVRAWMARDGAQAAAGLAAVGLGAFVSSHLLALAIGPWPAVLIVAAAMGAAAWARSDARLLGRRRGFALGPRAR
jgi:hypothetical protein